VDWIRLAPVNILLRAAADAVIKKEKRERWVICWVADRLLRSYEELVDVWFQASTAMYMRSALFWDVTERRVVVMYRRFGTSYWSRNPRSTKHLLGLFDPWRWDRYVVPKRRYITTTQRCVISQKSADLSSLKLFTHLQLRLIISKVQNWKKTRRQTVERVSDDGSLWRFDDSDDDYNITHRTNSLVHELILNNRWSVTVLLVSGVQSPGSFVRYLLNKGQRKFDVIGVPRGYEICWGLLLYELNLRWKVRKKTARNVSQKSENDRHSRRFVLRLSFGTVDVDRIFI
jgi:hypothetical protein